jgi:hypothetical protein
MMRFGEVAVRIGVASSDEVDTALRAQGFDQRNIGDCLRDSAGLTDDDVKTIIEIQEQAKLGNVKTVSALMTAARTKTRERMIGTATP